MKLHMHHIHYLYTEKSGIYFLPAKCAKKHIWKKDIPANDTGQ